jgi:hypothetical protein
MSIVSSLRWKRTLRTATSERLLALNGDRDAVAVDLHFLPDGCATGTVTVLDGSGVGEADLPELLARIDDDFLPGVDLEDGGVTFTVVFARGAQSFESARQG